MRYLVETFAVGALRRGQGIEQFIGAVQTAETPAIRWVGIESTRRGYEVTLHVVEDVGSENFCDLLAFPPLDPDDEFGRTLAVADDAAVAMVEAERRTGAVRHRWVNAGMARDEYLDYLRAGRPTT
ncbi:hypothetical protein ABZ642_05040 [Streptomyces sp. NPDC007157]|uniref:hypothetical protein n=1 Tax=Streptomyces sp. NPDC007157 TaxID=3154681 RepID=UPI003400CA05